MNRQTDLTMKKANIIISTYNGARYLPALLDSLCAQTYPSIDFYVRDDGSKDNTIDILREYQAKFTGERRFLLVNEADGDWTNKGAHESYRSVFRRLEPAFCYMICDQDDVWEPRKVQRAVETISRYPANTPVLYVHNYFLCDGQLHVKSKLPDRHSITPSEMTAVSLSKVIMTGTWAGVGMSQVFNHTLKQLAYDRGDITPSVATDCFVAWVAAGFNGALIYDNEPLAWYRRHEGTYSSGDATGLARYRDWLKHMDRHCKNITNGIHDYHILYGSDLSADRKAFLELFDSGRRLGKFFYPRRLRDSLAEEIAFRLLILAGKI